MMAMMAVGNACLDRVVQSTKSTKMRGWPWETNLLSAVLPCTIGEYEFLDWNHLLFDAIKAQ